MKRIASVRLRVALRGRVGLALLAAAVLWCVSLSAAAETYALVVGVGAYPEDSGFEPLKADADADAFATALTRLGVKNVTPLLNEKATRDEIGLWFVSVVPKPGDLVYIYLAGHGGGIDDRTGREAEVGAFFPYDARRMSSSLLGDVAEERSAITEYTLSTWILTGLRGCDVVVFIDACRSALIARSDLDLEPTRAVRGEGAFVPRGLAQTVRDPEDAGRTFVFASSSEYEPSFEDPTPGRVPHGLFTRCLLNGLVCDADDDPADGHVTFRELEGYLTESMANLSRSGTAKGLLQTPVAVCDQMNPESEEFRLAEISCDLAVRWEDDLAVEAGADNLVATGAGETGGESVVFADRELERVIRLILKKPWGDPIMRAECQEIRVLVAPDKGIRSLSGIQALANLTHADLRWNAITDFTPLMGMKQLVLLDLSSNQIEDLTPLKGLTQLTVLHLADNPIDDVTALLWLTQLKALRMSATQWGWFEDLLRTYDPVPATERVSGTVVLDPANSALVYPGVTYTFAIHGTMVVTGEPVVQIVRFLTQGSCEAKSECSRVVYAELLSEGEHSFSIATEYLVPQDAEPGRIIWYAFDVEFAPHSGWIVGSP
jgi:phage terminase large subunit-like protein